MKKHVVSIGFALFIFLFFAICFSQENKQKLKEFPVLKGEYFGLEKPGLEPELFAPGIISTENRDHSDLAFFPDGKEVYWSMFYKDGSGGVILFMKVENDRWTPPQVAPFSSAQYFDCFPSLSYDGKRLFYGSRRPIEKNTEPGDFNIWTVERIGTSWSEPKPLGAPINDLSNDANPAVVKNGTLYFASDRKGEKGSWDIYRSEFVNGRYSEPENLGEHINTENLEICTYVAPNESYLIFTLYKMADGPITGDIYISFQNSDNSWAKPKCMGEKINTDDDEGGGYVSRDGRFFFFLRGSGITGDVYWVDAKIIEELRENR